MNCHHCSRELALAAALQRTDSCPYCLSDLKCCLNCRFFDSSAPNQCREPQVEPVTDKEKANFCEFFSFRASPARDGGAASERDRARSTFDSLFKKK